MPTVQGTDDFTNVVAGNYDAFFDVDGVDPSGVTSPLYEDAVRSLRISPTGSNEGVRKNITGSPSRGWTAFPYRISSTPASGQGILRLHSVTSDILAQISISSGRAIFAFIGGGGTQSGPTLEVDTWYWIEAIYNVVNSTHTLLWRVNGIDQTPATVSATGSDSVDYAQLFSTSGGATWYAGGKWSWGSAASDTDWLGEPRTFSFPEIIDVTEGTVTSDSSTWQLTYPSGVQVGDLLLFALGTDGNPTVSSHDGGWVHIAGAASGGAASGIIGKKHAESALSGTFNVGLTQAQQGCWKVILIRGWHGNLGTNFSNSDANGGSVPLASFGTGAGTSIDLLAMALFGWGVEDTLWLPLAAADGGDTTFTANPTNFTPVGSNQESGGADGAALSVVSRQATADAMDPGAWTIDASEEWGGFQVAVRPAYFPAENTFEGGADETTITTENSGDASGRPFDIVTIGAGNGLVYDSAQAHEGSLSARLDFGDSSGTINQYGWIFANEMEIWGWCYFYFDTDWTGPTTIRIIGFEGGGVANGRVNILRDTRQIQLLDSNFAGAVNTTGAVALDAWYRVAFRVLCSETAGEMEARIYEGNSTTPISGGTVQTDSARDTGVVCSRATFGNNTTWAGTTYSFWTDNPNVNADGLFGPVGALGYSRVYGPAQLPNTATTLYTVPAGRRLRIRHIVASNPGGSSRDVTLSIGTDAAGVRILDGKPLAPGERLELRNRADYTLEAGEVLQGFASAAGEVVAVINGYEESV